MNNKIILFSNTKGGTGKSTLCAMFATYCAQNGIPVAVVDADLQQSLAQLRKEERADDATTKEPWQLVSLMTSSTTKTVQMMENLKTIPGWILVDCPGTLNDPGLVPIFKAADAVIVPTSYEKIVVNATELFVNVFRGISQAPLFFIPNRINDAEGTKTEREQRINTINKIGDMGLLTPRIKQSVVIKRFSTMYALDSYQQHAVEHPFNVIIDKLKK